MSAQMSQRRAVVTGRGDPDRGKCTIEVVVDGAAEVEIRGENAILRNLSGRPPEWRRFECTSVMPPNPADFRFAGVDGRGRQQLVRDPRSGGGAVVRIEDPDNGAEGYTFDLTWSGNGTGYANPNGYRGNDRNNQYGRDNRDNQDPRYGRNEYGRDQDSFHQDRETWFRGDNWRGQFFQRVRDDLNHVPSVTFPSGGDQ